MNDYREPWDTPKQRNNTVPIVIAILFVGLVLAVIMCIFFFELQRSDDSNSATLATAIPTDAVWETVPSEPPEDLTPENGYIFEEIDIPGVASLIISTKGCDQDFYFVLDPINLSASGEGFAAETAAKYSETRLFVRANSSVTVLVPLGEYRIFFATGHDWEGHYPLFGRKTTCYKRNETLEFSKVGNDYTSHTLKLEEVANGYIGFTKLDSKDDLPK